MVKAFNTLNSLIWPVVALTIAASWSLQIIIPVHPSWNAYLFWPDMIFKTFLTVLTTAFVHGFLVDLAAGTASLQTKEAFDRNSRAFFKAAFLMLLLPFPFHFISFALVGPVISFDLMVVILSPLITFIWLKVVFIRKFREKIKGRSSLLGPREWLTFSLLSLLYYMAHAAFFILPEDFSVIKHAGIFFLTYMNLWIFLVMAGHIIARFSLHTQPGADKKEIYLINPLWGGVILGSISLLFHRYPFVFVILKALTPRGYVFREFNQVLWRDSYYASGKLVAITCFTSNCIEAYQIAREFRERGSRVVMGGAHVTAFPEEALEFCDAVVVGPVEGVWERVIQDYESGRMQGIYSGAPQEETYAKVSKFLLAQPPAVISDCLETARGCKFNCYFCGGGHSKTGFHRTSIPDVIALINKIKRHTRTISFLDDNIYSDPAYTKELLRLIKPLKIRWSASATIDIAKDPETLQLCKESGCSMLLIGYEIFPGSKEERQGKFALSNDYMQLTRAIQKYGIAIKAHFIYGSETDDLRTFWQLWWFTLRLFPMLSSLCILTPVPNSRFYKKIEAEDRFINLNWSKYDFFSLVHQHPVVHNGLFRNGALFVVFFFILTTCRVGVVLLAVLIIYISCCGMMF